MRVSAGKSAKQVKFLENIYDQDFLGFQGILYIIWKEMSYWDSESDKETFSFFDYYILPIFCQIRRHKTPLNAMQCHTRVRTQKRKSGWKSYKCGAIEKWYLVKSRNRRRPYDLTWGVGNLGQGRLEMTSLDDSQHTFLNQARFTFLYNPQFQILIGSPKLVIRLFSANF